MSRPDPIEYAERLYSAIRAANFSPMSFLAFGNAVKDGVAMRSMPRIAAEPFMRIVGEMLDLEEQAADDEVLVEATVLDSPASTEAGTPRAISETAIETPPATPSPTDTATATAAPSERKRPGSKR